MAKTKISEYSSTANSNTDIASINIDEGCAPSGINNAIRALMAQLKNFQTGADGDSFNGPVNGTIGATTPAAGTFTSVTSSGDITINNGNADGGQLLLASSGYSNWGLDNYSGRLRAYYGSTEYFTINSSGNVGIGTNSPTSVANYKTLNVNGTTGGIFYLQSSGTNILQLSGDSSSVGVSGLTNIPMLFSTNNTERMRIDSSGNLLVGCTSAPSASVKGMAYGDFSIMGSDTSLVLSGGSNTGNDYQIGFVNGNGRVGVISTSGSTTTYSTSSDYRLKENVQPMTDALAKVAALKPCTYTWKADGSAGEGFIAHELQAVVPDCVTGEKDAVDAEGNPVYQGIDTSFLVATLTAAIQEQQTLIQEQQAIITSLTERISALEAK